MRGTKAQIYLRRNGRRGNTDELDQFVPTLEELHELLVERAKARGSEKVLSQPKKFVKQAITAITSQEIDKRIESYRAHYDVRAPNDLNVLRLLAMMEARAERVQAKLASPNAAIDKEYAILVDEEQKLADRILKIQRDLGITRSDREKHQLSQSAADLWQQKVSMAKEFWATSPLVTRLSHCGFDLGYAYLPFSTDVGAYIWTSCPRCAKELVVVVEPREQKDAKALENYVSGEEKTLDASGSADAYEDPVDLDGGPSEALPL